MISSQTKRVFDLVRFKLWLQIYYWRRAAVVIACSTLVLTGFYILLVISEFDDQTPLSTVTKKNHRRLLYPHTHPLIVKPQTKNQNRFRFLINEPHFCLEGKHLILIAVSSSPENSERRLAIRKTWGSAKNLNESKASLVFLLGKVNDVRMQKQIREESMSHRDVIQGNFQDTYRNLTLKSVMALKWFSSYCPGVKFLMKTDDDIYVNTVQLSHYLERRIARERWIVGCVKTHAGVPLKSKKNHRIPIRALPPGHPVFVAGAGYVISGDIVEELHQASGRLNKLPVEDVFVTGHCAREIGVKPEHNSQFSCGEDVRDYCSLASTMLTGHRVSAEKQLDIWNLVHKPEMCKNVKVLV